MTHSPLIALAARIARLATHYDVEGAWPEQSLQHLTNAGAWTWVIPRSAGGMELDPVSQTQAYEAVASGCMSCLLILTQRDAACELIAGGDNENLKADLLPRFARHELMTSVGISQITTSRQGGRPALTARGAAGVGFVLNGCMPWVTAAPACRNIVTAAVLPDGRQILAVLTADAPGVTIDPPMKLAALQSSLTCEVHLKNVVVPAEMIIRGPVERVLAARSTVKPLVVATAGIGLARAIMNQMQPLAERANAELRAGCDELRARYEAVRERLYALASALSEGGESVPKTQMRVAVNDLLVRAAAGLTIFAKGSGFLRQMDAQRLVREAMFFLVWSSPDDVRAGTLAALMERPDPITRSMDHR